MSVHAARKLVLLTGALSDLCIENGEENFISSGEAEMAAGATSIGIATAELAGAATNLLAAAGGGIHSVQAFTGIVNRKRISGRFSKVWFKAPRYTHLAI